jgi:broad specificity phosphatase PhoE
MKHDALRRLLRIATLLGIVALAHAEVAAPAASAADKLGNLSSVLGELRKGGLVIYFRHALTDKAGPTDEEADLANCATQRNLSAPGREQAAQIGKAIRALGIPIGTVTASPFCRCKDTAELAFGNFAVNKDLYFAIGTDASDTRRFTKSLRRMLSTVPATPTNAVIISHTANLREAAGLWPGTEGMAFVFRPLPGGEFEAIAKVMPDDWGNVARLESRSKAQVTRD